MTAPEVVTVTVTGLLADAPFAGAVIWTVGVACARTVGSTNSIGDATNSIPVVRSANQTRLIISGSSSTPAAAGKLARVDAGRVQDNCSACVRQPQAIRANR